jgi:hypothetical protein
VFNAIEREDLIYIFNRLSVLSLFPTVDLRPSVLCLFVLDQLELNDMPRNHKDCVIILETINAYLEGGLLFKVFMMGLKACQLYVLEVSSSADTYIDGFPIDEQ